MSSPAHDRRADRSSLDRVRVALERAGCRPKTRGDHIEARCPAHEDRKPSLSVDWRDSSDRGGLTVVYCHTGCGGDAVAAALGLSWEDLFDTEVSPGHRVQNSAFPDIRPRPAPAPRELPARRGWPSGLGKPAAVYPYRDTAGELRYEIGRFRTAEGEKTFRGRTPVPGRPGWYRHALPPMSDRVLYRMPELAAAIGRGDPVYVVEGEKDADAVAASGAAATSKPNGAIKHPDEWIPQWTAALTGAHVVIVADRDGAGYRHAAAVRDALGAAPASLRVVRTPIEREKADASEHLAAGLELADLEPVPAAELAVYAAQPLHSSANAETPPAEGRVLPGPWPAHDDRPGGGGGDPPAPALRIVRDEYLADETALYKLGPTRGRDPQSGRRAREAREVINARVRLARRVRRDMGDGLRPVVSHVDLEARRGGERVELAAVEWKDFETCTWAADLPWPDVTYRRTPAGRSDVVNAIATTSGEVPVVTAYGTLGWRRRDDGTWMYVHAGGALDVAGPVDGTRVDIPADLHCYALPVPPAERAELRAAVDASTAVLWALRARISAPVLGAAYRAILGESTTTVFLLGSTGTGKTGLAALLLQHSAPSVRHDRMPIPAGEDAATVTALEELRYIAGHVPFVADDLAPDRGADRAATRANVLARSQHNRVGKLRGKRDGGTRPHHYPRGLQVLTGEDGASAPSAENRIVYVPVARGEVDPRVLAELETEAQCTARGQLTAALIRWAAPRMDGMDDWIRRTRAEFAAALRDPAADSGPDARRADAAADLAVGWRAMLDAVTELGAITPVEAAELWAHAWCGLADAKDRQAAVTAGRTLVERAAEILQGALVSGRAYIAGPDGYAPDVPMAELRSWGWTPVPGLLAGSVAEARPNGACVGWLRSERLYLHPPAAMAVLQTQSRAEGEPLTALARGLGSELEGAGLIPTETSTDGRRRGTRLYFEGKQKRVWDLPVSWLFPTDPDTPPAPGLVPPPVVLPAAPRAAALPASRPVLEMQISTSVDQAESLDSEVAPEPEPSAEVDDGGPSAAAAPTEYRGLAVVVDADRAYLAAPGAPVAELPAPPAALADVLAWAETAPLGLHHDYARDDYGQVWLTPAAGKRYGLPTKRPATPAAAVKLAVTRELAAAGWQLGGKGLTFWWATAYRPGGRSVALAVTSWGTAGDCPLLAVDPGPATLAGRIADYARHLGSAWQVSSGVTGVRALELSRTRTKVRVTESADPVSPSKRGRADVPDDHDLMWQRPPEPDERELSWVHAYDLNGMYLAAAARVRLGLGPAEHRQAPAFDPNLPGYWRITAPPWTEARLPDPFDPTCRGRRRDEFWLTTPRLRAMAELGWWRGEPSEAYVWPELAAGNRVPGSRYLEQWADRLNAARVARTSEAGSGDPVLAAIKLTYAHAIGRLNKDDQAGRPLYRPDWRHHVMGTATGNLLRKLVKVAELTGRYPLAVVTDCVLYAAADPDPATACPAGLSKDDHLDRTGLGYAKPAGTVAMADVLPLLTAGKRLDKTGLMALFDETES